MSLTKFAISIEDGDVSRRAKAQYVSPVLSSYGSVALLTQGGSKIGTENASGSKGGSCLGGGGGNTNFPNRTCL